MLGADPSAGFSLLETLTALTILAIALAGLFQAHSGALRTATAADGYGQARILAHSLLSNAVGGSGAPPRPGAGREGAFSWEVLVSEPREAWAAFTSPDWRLYRVQVTVAWDRSRRIVLQSLKLARAREQG